MNRDFSRLDKLIQGFEEQKTMPGCAVSIMQDGQLVYEAQAGYADIASGKRVDAESMFRQASTTKLFTYVIMGMLYEEGRYLFSDPISKYLPEWTDTKKYVTCPGGEVLIEPLQKPITIRNAVTMMCGMPYCMAPMKDPKNMTQAAMSRQMEKLMEGGRIPTLREEVRAMSQVPVMFEPGSHWYYGFGSEITGALVEHFTDMPLREAFKKFIIEPLELEHTDTYITDANRAHIVTNYRKTPVGFEAAPKSSDGANDPAVSPVGARPNLLVSAHDFAVFMQMLAQGGTYKGKKFLGEGTVNMLHTNQLNEETLKDFENAYLEGYGYGFGFRTLLTQKYGHNGHLGAFGWTGGSGIWVEADPVAKISIAYMHNMMPNDELYHHHRIRTVAYGCLL